MCNIVLYKVIVQTKHSGQSARLTALSCLGTIITIGKARLIQVSVSLLIERYKSSASSSARLLLCFRASCI